MMTVDEAIAELTALSRRGYGKRPLVFGDGSPVQFSTLDNKELSTDKFIIPVVQVRLDRTALART